MSRWSRYNPEEEPNHDWFKGAMRMTPDREPSDVYIDTQAKRMDALRLKPHEPDDYGDLLQRQEPLTEEEIIRGYSADPSELGSISTTEGLEQQTELDEETNPRLFK